MESSSCMEQGLEGFFVDSFIYHDDENVEVKLKEISADLFCFSLSWAFMLKWGK